LGFLSSLVSAAEILDVVHKVTSTTNHSIGIAERLALRAKGVRPVASATIRDCQYRLIDFLSRKAIVDLFLRVEHSKLKSKVLILPCYSSVEPSAILDSKESNLAISKTEIHSLGPAPTGLPAQTITMLHVQNVETEHVFLVRGSVSFALDGFEAVLQESGRQIRTLVAALPIPLGDDSELLILRVENRACYAVENYTIQYDMPEMRTVNWIRDAENGEAIEAPIEGTVQLKDKAERGPVSPSQAVLAKKTRIRLMIDWMHPKYDERPAGKSFLICVSKQPEESRASS